MAAGVLVQRPTGLRIHSLGPIYVKFIVWNMKSLNSFPSLARSPCRKQLRRGDIGKLEGEKRVRNFPISEFLDVHIRYAASGTPDVRCQSWLE